MLQWKLDFLNFFYGTRKIFHNLVFIAQFWQTDNVDNFDITTHVELSEQLKVGKCFWKI